ncbi:biotin transporter BioY [filamentous cyanobacterium LEGE 11480]|uniref:Biotin transporter n=1 Tax=Romeriopsis navalis LEGE 11480 TaxID=2777977 RepID=A0A928Z3T5_9CYAN|nr:biotin transporter BioY [Romeriopsis navalis]MBE9029598.1 biotin transporter BioY [Romeriopsis navalis LEGE 11480]
MFSFFIDRLSGLPRFIVVTLTELMWALTGLLLTIGGNFVQAAMLGIGLGQIPTYLLGVSYQIGAVLLIGCLAGRNAAVISQIAYLVLGLAGFQIFSQGGGIGYLGQPTFGYLLGFVPGAWLCGYLAFRAVPKLEWLVCCCMAGLVAIHATGITYLSVMHGLRLVPKDSLGLFAEIGIYSLQQLPGQIGVVCAVTVVAFLFRRAMFY